MISLLDVANDYFFLFCSAKRPPVEETANFLQALLNSHGPNFLEKLFGVKARNALEPLGGVERVAIALSGSRVLHVKPLNVDILVF